MLESYIYNIEKSWSKIWKKYGWELLLVCTIIVFIFAAIYYSSNKDKQQDILDMSFVYKNFKPKKRNNKDLDYLYYQKKTQQPKDSKGEIECKRCIEKLLNRPFNKIRPDFLKNNVTGKNLELDLYNSDLNLCVEMNGRQHYEFVPYFHRNYEAFLNQRYRDEMKKNKCSENGVKFIEVPYTVKIENIENYLKQELIKLGFL